MPRLFASGPARHRVHAHHSVFPTVTRVNASSFVTGAYPETHGLLGNDIYIPSVNASRGLDTGERENLEAVARADGRLLTAPTLGEILQRAGQNLLAVSSGSTGSALLARIPRPATVRSSTPTTRCRPSLARGVLAALGPAPPHATPNDPQNQRAIDAYLKFGMEHLRPDVTLMWLNDPDGTAHVNGIGAPPDAALVDARRCRHRTDRRHAARAGAPRSDQHHRHIRPRVLDSHRHAQARARWWIRSFERWTTARRTSSWPKAPSISAARATRPGCRRLWRRFSGGPRWAPSSRSPGACSSWAPRRRVPPTTSPSRVLCRARCRSTWRGGETARGRATSWCPPTGRTRRTTPAFAGTTTQEGVAGHGTSSPYDIHNTLIAAGPDFREHATSEIPTGNVDLAPTLLQLLGLPVPQTMTGRVMRRGAARGADNVHGARRAS